MKSKIMLVLLFLALFMVAMPTAVLADSYDGATGTVTIDTPWTSGTLENAVNNAVAGPGPVNNLYITAGTITVADETYINGLSSLQVLDISNATTYDTVSDSIFDGHSTIQSITLPCTSTGRNFAYDCPNLTSVSLPKATTFGIRAFAANLALTTISLPEATTFGDYAVAGNTSLTTISLPKATTFGNFAFYQNPSLKSVSLPKAKTFGNYSFANNSLLTSVSIPSATSIGDFMFNSCPLQIELELGSTPPTITLDTFTTYDVLTLSSIVNVPEADRETYDLDDGVDDDLWHEWTLRGIIAPITTPAPTQVVNPQTGDADNYGLIFVLSAAVLIMLVGFVTLKLNKAKAK